MLICSAGDISIGKIRSVLSRFALLDYGSIYYFLKISFFFYVCLCLWRMSECLYLFIRAWVLVLVPKVEAEHLPVALHRIY